MFDAEQVSRDFISAGGKLILIVTAGPMLARTVIESVLSLAGIGWFSSQIAQAVVLYIAVLLAYSVVSGTGVSQIPAVQDMLTNITEPFRLLEQALSI